MSDGAGGENVFGHFTWRDSVEGRFARIQAQIEHGEREDDRNNQAVQQLAARMEKMFEQQAATSRAESEHMRAELRLMINERLAHNERVMVERLDAMQEEMRQHVPMPAAQLPEIKWRWVGLAVVVLSGMLIATGIAIGLTMTKQTVAEVATRVVTP